MLVMNVEKIKTRFGKVITAVSNFFGGGLNRNAILIECKDGSYIVGKNFRVDENNEVSWSWGCYDIKTIAKGVKIMENWIRYN